MTDVANTYPLFLFINIVLGLVLSLALSRAAIVLARRVGLMDVPGALPHKQHAAPMPLAGGTALLLALGAGILLFNWEIARALWNILLPALIVFAFGVWDDLKRLSAGMKFIGQALAALVLIALGTHVQIIQPGFLGLHGAITLWINWAITLFWIVGITNALNLIDSMDGIVVGVSSIALAFIMLVIVGSEQTALLRLLALLFGIGLGLNYYNASPAKLFLGDSGAQTFGFLLAAIGIIFTPGSHPQASSWFLPILILGLPIFDTTLVTLSRLFQGTPIYAAGHDHTYHRLIALGFDPARAVQLMHLASIVSCCIAFVALRLDPFYANLLFAGAGVFALGVILIFIRRK
jgi:UDP-GlcNAc:undecaprenyl-phosphate GlcNAc-1-phosphate transferase